MKDEPGGADEAGWEKVMHVLREISERQALMFHYLREIHEETRLPIKLVREVGEDEYLARHLGRERGVGEEEGGERPEVVMEQRMAEQAELLEGMGDGDSVPVCG